MRGRFESVLAANLKCRERKKFLSECRLVAAKTEVTNSPNLRRPSREDRKKPSRISCHEQPQAFPEPKKCIKMKDGEMQMERFPFFPIKSLTMASVGFPG